MVWITLHLVPAIFVCLGAYLLGYFTTGYYLVRFAAHRDLRQEGSGSLGARNAGRILGTTGFVLVLIVDFCKGVLAVWLTRWFTGCEKLVLLAFLAVVVGHIWPFQLGFRGGKGVSTSLCALLVFDSAVALSFAEVAGLAAILLRKFSFGGLIGFVALPWIATAWQRDADAILTILLIAVLVLSAHGQNVERKFNQTKPEKEL